MSSKQQSSRQSQDSSPLPSKSATKPLILSNTSFRGQGAELLRDLRRNYSGIEKVSHLYLQDNEGKSIDAIGIQLKSDDLVRQFFDNNINRIRIFNDDYSIESSTRSLVVSNVPSGDNDAKLLQDLGHNYLGIEKISRFVDVNGQPLAHIRIDFKSGTSLTKIFKDSFILIDGKRRPVQSYYTLGYNSSPKEENGASENSQKSVAVQPQRSAVEQSQRSVNKQPANYLTERRLADLSRNHQMQLEAMINGFENRWNTRLSTLTTTSTNSNVDQLLPILKDLTTVCQQFSQQNAQIQRQLGSVVHRIQDIQTKLNNEPSQQTWSQLPVQNGH